VDGADARDLELAEGAVQVGPLLRGGRAVVARLLQLGAQPELHLARGLLREGDRHDPLQIGDPRPQHGDDARHQHGGLAGPRRSLDDERALEILADAAARAGVVQRVADRGAGDRRGGLGGGGGHRREGRRILAQPG
jgi:hypothetical protein